MLILTITNTCHLRCRKIKEPAKRAGSLYFKRFFLPPAAACANQINYYQYYPNNDQGMYDRGG